MFSVEKTEFPLPNVWKLLTYELIKGPCFWRATVLAKRTECAQIFVGQDYLAVEPQAADFKELLVPFYETIRTSLNALSSLSLRAMSTIRYASYFLPSISASLKSLTYFFFFFVFSFLPLLFASICLSFSSCFWLVCVAAVPDTCLRFLSTLWPPDELYAQKLKYKAISEELDHALNDMTSL